MYPTMPGGTRENKGEGLVKTRMGHTCLEDTLASNALAVCAEADATKDGAICELKDSTHRRVFILYQGSSDGRGRKAMAVVCSRTSEDGPDGVYFEGGIGQSHGVNGQTNGLGPRLHFCWRLFLFLSARPLQAAGRRLQGCGRVQRKRKRTSVYPPNTKNLRLHHVRGRSDAGDKLRFARYGLRIRP